MAAPCTGREERAVRVQAVRSARAVVRLPRAGAPSCGAVRTGVPYAQELRADARRNVSGTGAPGFP
jgi:hypothetical protein